MSASIPKLVVLGLLSNGAQHGYEMEEEIERSNMRMWARIGMSSIYKALSDLENEGHVGSKAGKALRGPGKKVFTIRATGKVLLEKEIRAALASTDPVYSQRITGAAFALRQFMSPGPRPGKSHVESLRRSFEGLQSGVEHLKAEKKRASGDVSSQILLDYYLDIYKAELRALDRVIKHLIQTKKKDPA